jgi:hypothetical protein
LRPCQRCGPAGMLLHALQDVDETDGGQDDAIRHWVAGAGHILQTKRQRFYVQGFAHLVPVTLSMASTFGVLRPRIRNGCDRLSTLSSHATLHVHRHTALYGVDGGFASII